MKYRDAKKLHNEDEVIEKKTNVVLRVLNVQIEDKNVFLSCVSESGNYRILTHKEIR